MVNVEVSLASEITSLLNFLIIDILLLSYITHISGLLAGHSNHHILCSRGRLHLSTFDAPLIGGGLVTARGPRRNILILLRLSVVVAAAVCNFGLEGRSRPSYITTNATTRRPGPLLDDEGMSPMPNDVFDVMYGATELRMNCFDLSESVLTYRDVIGGSCYRNLNDSVFIHAMDLKASYVRTRATECVAEVDCDAFRTIFRCKESDMVCSGFDNPEQCPCTGPAEDCQGEQPKLLHENCVAVVYAEDGNEGWICDREKVYPNKTDGMELCVRFEARREDVADWVRFYLSATLEQQRALFAAAYGEPKREMVRVPTGEERAVTVVSWFWFVPVGWMVAVTVGLTGWRVAHVWRGTPLVAHDEAGLTRLLDRQIEGKYGRMGRGRSMTAEEDLEMGDGQATHPIPDGVSSSTSTIILRR